MVHYIGFDDRYKMRLVFYAGANSRHPRRRLPRSGEPEGDRLLQGAARGDDARRRERLYPARSALRCSKLLHLHRLEPRWLGHHRADGSGVQPVHAPTTTATVRSAEAASRSKIRFELDAKRTDRGLKGDARAQDHRRRRQDPHQADDLPRQHPRPVRLGPARRRTQCSSRETVPTTASTATLSAYACRTTGRARKARGPLPPRLHGRL